MHNMWGFPDLLAGFLGHVEYVVLLSVDRKADFYFDVLFIVSISICAVLNRVNV